MVAPLMEELARLLPAVPRPFETDAPGIWHISGSALAGSAGPETNLFIDPLTGRRELNAPMLLFPSVEDFVLSARVEVDFHGTFDAGALVLHQDPSHWAKLCFEYSPAHQPMMVSVVTRGVSDDCNSAVLTNRSVYLRIARIDGGYAFHYSAGGQRDWQMVRLFALPAQPTKAGFLVQSPRGEGCKITFSEINYRQTTLADIRSGE